MPDYSKTRIQLRRGTASELAAANPTLGVGEPAFATDTNTLKIGDGSTAYSSLSAITGGGGGGGGISNVVEDTTPQLGGNLDTNNKEIVFTSGSTQYANIGLTASDLHINVDDANAEANADLIQFNIDGTRCIAVTSPNGLDTTSIYQKLVIDTNGQNSTIFGFTENTFNSNKNNIDFAVHGDSVDDVLFVDASADSVGIKTATPASALDVNGIITGNRHIDLSTLHIGSGALSANTAYTGLKHTAMTGANDFMIASSGDDTYISAKNGEAVHIRGGGNASEGQISVYDVGAGNNAVVINELAADRDFRIESASKGNAFKLDASTSKIGIGAAVPAHALHVIGDVFINDSYGIVMDAAGFSIKDDTVGNTLDASLLEAVAIGEGAKTFADKSVVLANGRFAADGDAQNIRQVLRGSTTNNSLFYLSSLGTSSTVLTSASDTGVMGTANGIGTHNAGISLPNNSVFTFTIHISCRKQSSTDSAAFIIRGAVKNTKGWATTDVSTNLPSDMAYALVGTPIVESYIDSGLSGVTATVTTSYYNALSTNTLANSFFGVQVNGLNSTNLRWVATVDGTLVTY